MDAKQFFEKVWDDYIRVTPQANKINQLFKKKYGQVVNDHIAFRTFNLTPLSVGELEHFFFEMDYRFDKEYQFEEKKLYARSYVHPDESMPMIFFSQLLTEQLSKKSQIIISKLVEQINKTKIQDLGFFYSGLGWEMPTYDEYLVLLKESEYAAWLSVMGMRANHFTLRVSSITNALDLVEENNFLLNISGGKVKGSPQLLLEQGATLADSVLVTFKDGTKQSVPTCYYEFAKRYLDPSGNLYRGFVTSSADKIFESTNQGGI
ncbi:MAG: hypothetical protein A2381_02055 [Bdellovibrionales bacterium RIFOXYB1_FULL_37_110]|nr:MAG: hypothetical protein A2417_13360 [Bdellovibrionales bacterium RIFOXYC1_FULL_37_79]OFZ53554.1 MAG: hypothetical protein A2328_11330 [Bdellovibrionales bacterium RIFOXYB2_FULL_36_6]OFZ59223.1 MAG: hypothetical protein A2381_02055 [Bdellovibrionales bacterium RIFOXYB1_FULL_37_110]OFZ62849.1 MAG: hypothetical protein A2577_11010 [Bdellovibrionales bacterium RIFOXYD1_FULL_36_51]